jgi:hypothetical protein
MTLTYIKNKKYIYKWVENNKEKNRKYNALFNRKKYNWKKISKIYLNILLD